MAQPLLIKFATRLNGVVTLQVDGHGLTAGNVGQLLQVTGVPDKDFNGRFTISKVPDSNTVQYLQSGVNDRGHHVSGGAIAVDGGNPIALFVKEAIRLNGVDTITVTGHGLTVANVGNKITIQGVSDPSFNVVSTISAVPDANTIQLSQKTVIDRLASIVGGAVAIG